MVTSLVFVHGGREERTLKSAARRIGGKFGEQRDNK
jgi:hypothetical protein